MGGIGYFAGNRIQVVKENMAEIEYAVIVVFVMSLQVALLLGISKPGEK